MSRNSNDTTYGRKILAGMIKDGAFRSEDDAAKWLKKVQCPDG